LLDTDFVESKRKTRDRIRQLPNGEIEWQRCQALLYGPRINDARLIEGVPQFFELCRQRGLKVYVVSHKTEFSRFDTTGTNLREAALAWMTSNGFFEPDRLGLTQAHIVFANNRQEKINWIRQLRCTDFIDDLEETFLEATFPPSTTRILYEPGRELAPPAGVMLMETWQEISDYFFHSN
jgi:diaminopimelate decarboxylase